MKRRITPNDRALIRERYLAGMKPMQIAAELDLDRDDVNDAIRSQKLVRQHGTKAAFWTSEEVAIVERGILSDPPMTMAQISALLVGRTEQAVSTKACEIKARLARAAVPIPKPLASRPAEPPAPAPREDVIRNRRGVSLPRLRSLELAERLLGKEVRNLLDGVEHNARPEVE